MGLPRLSFLGGVTREPRKDLTLHDSFGIPDDEQWDDLTEREQSAITHDFVVNTSSESPPPKFGDLKDPVVLPHGNLDPSDDELNMHAVDTKDRFIKMTDGISEKEKKHAIEKMHRLRREYD